MITVQTIFSEHSRVSAIAREMQAPVGTVWSWKKKGEIPTWRRPAVLDAVRRLKLEVSDEALAYLTRAAKS